VAFLSFSTFGNPMREKAARIRDTINVMNTLEVDFEYDGEMAADVALNKDLMALYPFCRLSAPANVLIMPALHTAHISSKMLQELGDGVTIGPIVMGLEKPAQIAQMNANVSDILNLAAIAAADAIESQGKKVTALHKVAKKK
jgi:malate dehydrogenase (oxaloacetate-decarboxylating)(NADP+)